MVSKLERPVFVLDSREQWLPCSVATIHRVPGVQGGFDCDPVSLNFPANMTQPPDTRPAAYVRERDGGGIAWRQWWLWWLYNPGPLALQGVGRHEGDWEFTQVGHVSGTPVQVTVSQHQSGGRRDYWACDFLDERPLIFVALGSHAMYFQPGRNGLDVCDGHGHVISDYDELAFGPWGRFEGRWGASSGEGRSPSSPGKQGDRCDRPHLYHSSCRPA